MAEEKQFENKVKSYLSAHSAWYIKYWAGAVYTKKGIPDILVCYDGSFVALEVKASNGKPTLLQLKNLAAIRKAGGYGLLLYPQDFNDFKKFLNNRHPDDSFYLDNIEKQFHWEKQLLKEECKNGTNTRQRAVYNHGRQHSRLGTDKNSRRGSRARQTRSYSGRSYRSFEGAD